jgi:hypothetical protein
MTASTFGNTCETHVEDMQVNHHDSIRDMLHDVFPMHARSVDGIGVEEHIREAFDEGPSEQQRTQVPNKNAQAFYDLLKDAEQPFYQGCTNYTKLSAILHLYHIKCLKGLTNDTFTLILQVLKDMLPSDAQLPKDYYEAKKIIKGLGLGYEKIHACPKDCMLFWKEHANDDFCECGASRWQTDETNESNLGQNPANLSKKVRKKPAKVLRWFPIKPKLQRWFMCSKTASSMKWHDEGRCKDGKMRHPADSPAWKAFDSLFVDFSSDPRNVRLGLATDGFNPHNSMNNSYSIWPVMLVPYNLPPWMCMKRASFMLSLLIPGPNSPTNDIDVYLQPLIEELKELWEVGVETYDVSSKENFQMRAALLWTIHDLPGYGDVSGWSTKGALACPFCNYSTHSEWLKNGGKYCFMGHRRFLDEDHPFRNDTVSFDGTQEMEPAPTMLSGIEAKAFLESIEQMFGKTDANLKKSRNRNSDGTQPWKKQSIFFQLSYWPYLMLRHMLDVMHIQTNVFDNVLGTTLNLDGKTKDNLKARLDLVEKGIRSELHPQNIGSGRTYLPPACFSMVPKDKDEFLKVLKGIKVPDGYASNISRCIKLKQRKIGGLKSHDAHVMMQQLLPIALRGSLPKKVVVPLIELCCYFREVCSKVLEMEQLERLEKQIPVTLCKLEQIFPPSFFTIMVHLVVHLATEAKIAGPVHYRWMFPIERFDLCRWDINFKHSLWF